MTGANFQGTPLAFALEFLGIGLTTIGALSERRMNRLVNPNLNMGLPAFLTKGAGMFSGMMLAQYTAAALVCENRYINASRDRIDTDRRRSRRLCEHGGNNRHQDEGNNKEFRRNNSH